MYKTLIRVLVFGVILMGVFSTRGNCAEPEHAGPPMLTSEDRASVEEQGFVGVSTAPAGPVGTPGVRVISVAPGSAAETAGVEVGDVILAVDGRAVGSTEDLGECLGGTKAGQELKLTISRDDRKREVAVTLLPAPPRVLQAKLRLRLGTSWRDQADEAFGQKDWDEAIAAYARWLEADPQDNRAWYGLACAYALKGDTANALGAWESAVDAGWLGDQSAAADPDLKAIASHERFRKALERCSTNQAAKGPTDYKRNFTTMNSLGTYIVMLPPDYDESSKEYPLCLILHGHGSSETGHGTLADELGRDEVVYVAPRYAYPFTEDPGSMDEPGWTAWPPYDLSGYSLLHPVVDRLNTDWVFACADDARKRYRVQGDKVFLLGHSQGAFLANACAALHPELVRSYFAYAGLFPDPYLGKERLAGLKENGVRVYLAHGTEDQVCDPAASRKLEQAMKKAGVTCRLETFKAEHSFTSDVYTSARKWLDKEVRTGGPAEK